MTESGERERILQAAREMDWQQVALNHVYGPPCFHLFDDGFCGRPKRWDGHGDPNHHNFVSFADLLGAAFEAGRGGWISVEERLPDLNDRVLTCDSAGRIVVNCRLAKNWAYRHEDNKVTHWMELPAPPDSGDEKGTE